MTDSGIDYTHEDLQFVVSPVTPLQTDDHGNHVQGIIAALATGAIPTTT